jgi:hypothetical protein
MFVPLTGEENTGTTKSPSIVSVDYHLEATAEL